MEAAAENTNVVTDLDRAAPLSSLLGAPPKINGLLSEQRGLGVHRAMLGIKAELSTLGISKSEKNQAQGFQFRGIDQVLNVLSPLLVKHGLIILPCVVERWTSESPTKSGGVNFSVTVRVEYTLMAAADGSTVKTTFEGEAKDAGDKATGKALSIAYKTMAFQTFCIPIAGALPDPDRDTAEESLPKRGRAITRSVDSDPAPRTPRLPASNWKSRRPQSWDEVIAALKASVSMNELMALREAMLPLVHQNENDRDAQGRTPFEREIRPVYLAKRAELEGKG